MTEGDIQYRGNGQTAEAWLVRFVHGSAERQGIRCQDSPNSAAEEAKAKGTHHDLSRDEKKPNSASCSNTTSHR